MIAARWDDREYGSQTVAPLSVLKVSFDRVWPWLKKAVAAYGPTHRKRHVWQQIEAGSSQLWTTEHAAVVTSVKIWPTGLKELLWWLAAGDWEDGRVLLPIIETWAADKGCTRCCIKDARVGWQKRMPEYRRVSIALLKDI